MVKGIIAALTILLIGAICLIGYAFYSLQTVQRQALDESSKVASLTQQLNESERAFADSAAKAKDLESKLAGLESQIKQLQSNNLQQTQKFPVQILESLNDMLSAIQTGVTKTDYSAKLIAIKTAVSTYGSHLPGAESTPLVQIIGDYDAALYFWNKQSGDSSIINIGGGYDYQRDKKVLADAGLKPMDESMDYMFNEDTVLRKFWAMGEQATQALLQQQASQ